MYSIFLSSTTKTNGQYDEGNVLKTWSHSPVWRLEEGHGGASKWAAVWRALLPEPGTPNTDGDAQGGGHLPKALKAAAGPCETHFLFLPRTPRRNDWARKHHKETANPAGGGSECSNWGVPACSVARSCPALWDPVDYHPPGSSVHGILRQEYWNPGVGCHFLLQRIFLTQRSSPCLLHCRQIFFIIIWAYEDKLPPLAAAYSFHSAFSVLKMNKLWEYHSQWFLNYIRNEIIWERKIQK